MTTNTSSAFESEGFRRARPRAADQVTDHLRSKIYSGALERGVKLPSEKDLAVYYGVSAPTISEAIRALSALKLVEARHGSGTYVTADSDSVLAQALQAVVELEKVDLESVLDLSDLVYGKAVSLGVERATDDEILELREAAESFRAPTHSETEHAAAIERFMSALVQISHNSLLIAMSHFLIQKHIALAREAALISSEMWGKVARKLIDERLAIVDAVARRDAAAADSAIHAFLVRGRQLVLSNASRVAGEGPAT
ncbi:FadR/GntR family transcriptional regulator [Streptomyces sp. NPDC056716]|uniref:FadR/GntR family transcriptional regulator n=1 Tax=unclassified Streptomyces TaxID=2593676 RepID=UPI00367B31C2